MKSLKTNAHLKSSKPLKAKSDLKKNLKPKKQVKLTVTKLKKDATKYFNKSIKYRDSEYIEGEWLFKCITCNKRVLFRDREGHFYRNAHAGHFMPETKTNTRYNDMNVNGQCGLCNFNQGEQYKYAKELEIKYGLGTAEELVNASKENHQFTIQELEAIIEESKEAIKYYEESYTGT